MMRHLFVCVIALFWPVAALAQHYNSYGLPGLIDMRRSPALPPDAELAFTPMHFAGQTCAAALPFNCQNWLSASLGYARLRNLADADGRVYPEIFDRSFGLHYRLFDETQNRPAIAIGVNDLVGTGVYAGEYVSRPKRYRRISARHWVGLGAAGKLWRLCAAAGRPAHIGYRGRRHNCGQHALSRGCRAFWRVRYQLRDDIALIAEYSSDAYRAENGRAFTHRSPVNVGLSYQPRTAGACRQLSIRKRNSPHAHNRLDPTRRRAAGAGAGAGASTAYACN